MVGENELNVNLKKRKEKKKENGVEKRVSKPKKMRSTCMNKKKKKKKERKSKVGEEIYLGLGFIKQYGVSGRSVLFVLGLPKKNEMYAYA